MTEKKTVEEPIGAREFLDQWMKERGHEMSKLIGWSIAADFAEAYAAQQSKIYKPDVNLEYWQKWLTEHGYQIEFDADGLWAEDWVQEHKWVDIFDLMMQFAIEQQSKMLPSELLRQRDELREALKRVHGYWSRDTSPDDMEDALWEMLDIAEAAIKNTDG